MTAAANSDARKRLAEQETDTTLVDILDAYFYSQNSVNWHRRHAEAVAAIVAEHYGAVVAAERERADAAEYDAQRYRAMARALRDAEAKVADAWDEGHRRGLLDAELQDVAENPYRAALGGEATP